ncbi:methyltransferase domain-containing protein [Anatilimnocola sp. NA78]|uniref:class I SAM-dependent methyltransferase n=1 Tax=Anatilimnocola sp. NA78 TaxID=3415683 RepID=UPI003CE56D24
MLKRLNWGCGPHSPLGWVNSDIEAGVGVDIVADIRRGLPFPDDHFDYIVSIHVLPELAYRELDPALRELYRVLKPGGVLRLSLPDLDLAIDAYRSRDVDYFLIGDDEVKSLAGKLIVQLLWYGRSRSMFTWEFTQELLARTGYREITRCKFQESASGLDGITELDNRPLESLFVEARK